MQAAVRSEILFFFYKNPHDQQVVATTGREKGADRQRSLLPHKLAPPRFALGKDRGLRRVIVGEARG